MTQELEEKTYNNIPPVEFKRNKYGLVENLDYKFLDDGRVDWRAMLKPEHLVINKYYEKAIEEELKKPISEVQPHEVKDYQLLILLSGIKYLCHLVGFNYVKYSRPAITDNSVAVTCEIEFQGNYQTDFKPQIYSACADATKNNCSVIGKNKMGEWCFYLTPIAENRSFCRTVRNYLNISVISRDEISNPESVNFTPSETVTSGAPLEVLELKMKAANVTFEKLILVAKKEKWQKDLVGNIDEWKSIKDISSRDIYTISGKLSK